MYVDTRRRGDETRFFYTCKNESGGEREREREREEKRNGPRTNCSLEREKERREGDKGDTQEHPVATRPRYPHVGRYII